MERLTNRADNGMAYLVNIKNDEQDLVGSYNTLKCVIEAFEKLARYEDMGEPEEIASLRIDLAESQRRERAAVEDLMDALYDPLSIDCEYCKYYGAETDEHIAKTGGCHACENHGGFPDCFEWRGPEAGEGE